VHARLSLYRTPLQALQRVSGRLRNFLRGPESVDTGKPKSPHLLVVDDEESICLSMKDYFSRNGFIVDTAQEVEEAEQLIENCNYEVIIQDLRMGLSTISDGLELVRLAYQRSAETRIVVLTAYGSAEDESEAKRSGADAFLRKPQPLSQIAQVVRGVMESPRHQKITYS
jgi:DNA-binding NtrC family response regulator